MNQTIDEQLRLTLEQQRAAFAAEPMPTLAVRRDRLQRLHAMTAKHADELAATISRDFGHRARQESLLTDVFTVQSAARHALRHVRGWMKPRRVPTAMHFWPAYNRLLRQPLGVVGIVSPWNYPYNLAMSPAAAALAAGNRVMIKPSEATPETSALMARIVAAHFAPEEMQVIIGDAEVGRAFTALPFDHLFFTGSTAVGRAVALAAAKNLTPVTLELGGKSPAIVDRSAPLAQTAERLAFGKLLNAGQTCVAPDYVLAPREMVEPLARAIVQTAQRLYPRVADNPDYTSIVSPRHHARLQHLLDDARAKGAQLMPTHANEQPGDRRLVPHLLLGVNDQMAVMQEEIFGPLLPIVPYEREEDAIAYVRAHDRPLALYWFGSDEAEKQRVLERSLSGGVTINEAMMHAAMQDAPFGGIGASGMGHYHGREGFLEFSHARTVFEAGSYDPRREWGLLPPYGEHFLAAMEVQVTP